jgi:hypothetical protein
MPRATQNFIQPVDSVFVFKNLVDGQLVYGGTLTFPFEPSRLTMNPHGRIYHPSPKPDIARVSCSSNIVTAVCAEVSAVSCIRCAMAASQVVVFIG